jgi:hypothetical protein
VRKCRPTALGLDSSYINERTPMNNRYFGCWTCKTYTDAGYRWACYQLEDTGIIRMDQPIDVRAVLEASDYWNPPAGHETDWHCDEVLPRVRRFLGEHGDHHIIYINREWAFDPGGPLSDWVEWRGCDLGTM